MDAGQKPPSVKKKPLSDRTNFTVPTSSVIRKLKSALSSPQNPKPDPKPYNSSSVAKRLELDWSESETSIGSSNFNEISSLLPPRLTPHRLPLIDISKRSCNVSEAVYSRKKAPEKAKDKGEQVSAPLTIDSARKTRSTGKSAAVPTGQTKHTEKVSTMPIRCTSMAIARNKVKENIEPFSCPRPSWTRKKRTASNESGNIGVSHSYTAPQPNHNKKKSRLLTRKDKDDTLHALPREYVEQQRAYFKEIDDFELAEEEVSENDSDNENTSREPLTK